MKKNWIITAVIAFLTLIIGVTTTYFVLRNEGIRDAVVEQSIELNANNTEKNEELEELSEFLNILHHLRTNHYFFDEDIDLIQGAIEGMIATIDDPWAWILSNSEAQARNNLLQANLASGINIEISEWDGYFVVVEVGEELLASETGILLGDAIISVNGGCTKGTLIGEPGEVIMLELQRGNKIFELELANETFSVTELETKVFEQEDQRIG